MALIVTYWHWEDSLNTTLKHCSVSDMVDCQPCQESRQVYMLYTPCKRLCYIDCTILHSGHWTVSVLHFASLDSRHSVSCATLATGNKVFCIFPLWTLWTLSILHMALHLKLSTLNIATLDTVPYVCYTLPPWTLNTQYSVHSTSVHWQNKYHAKLPLLGLDTKHHAYCQSWYVTWGTLHI